MIVNLPLTDSKLKISLVKNKSTIKSSRYLNANYNKVFIIGFNKTGTSSLKTFLQSAGFKMGNQAVAETFAEEWLLDGRSDRIIKYCHTAEAFQDIPFSLPFLYKELDQTFPNSKFILSVRDSPEQWFESLINYHTKLYATDLSKGLTPLDLANETYCYKGWQLDIRKFLYNFPEIGLSDKDYYTKVYINHICDVKSYFDNRSDQFLCVNVSKKNDFNRLIKFLNIKTSLTNFPRVNSLRQTKRTK